MTARANAEWQRWGEVDPLFGVASWSGKGIGDTQPWTDDEFYSLGEADWTSFLERWRRYGVVAGSCVEIGCGAARLTRPMARFFSHVHALDVSAGMLARAAPAVAGLAVTLHHTDGLTIPLGDSSVDAAFSTHVFQHLDSVDDAVSNWHEIVRVLAPGATMMVHLPIHIWPLGLGRLEVVHSAKRAIGDWRARARRRGMVKAGAPPIMRGQSYLWWHVEELLSSLGMADLELSIFRVGANDGVHPVVLARKPR